jgi:hypothetical protein
MPWRTVGADELVELYANNMYRHQEERNPCVRESMMVPAANCATENWPRELHKYT